jgi:hypothetical protein
VTWVKIDDGQSSHPKMVRCDLAAKGLWLDCLTWSAHELTDGFIPAGLPKQRGARGNRLTGQLVAAGLWEIVPGGWQIHDYLEYNPSREQVEEKRAALHEARSKAGTVGGQRSAERRLAETGTSLMLGARNNPNRSIQPNQAPNSHRTPVARSPYPVESTYIEPNGSHPASEHESGRSVSTNENTKRNETRTERGKTPRPVAGPWPAQLDPAAAAVDGSTPPCPKCSNGHVDQRGKFLGCHQCGWVMEGSLKDIIIPVAQAAASHQESAA